MRKDVRMGFAVGGVLLAVLVVAILAFHHKSTDKAVAFDSGGKSGADLSATDTSLPPDGPPQIGTSQIQTPAQPPAINNPPAEPKAPSDDAPQKGGAKWDALFASTAADPIKAQLTSETLGKPKNKSKKHKSDSVSMSDTGDKRDASSTSAVANAPLDTAMATPAPEASAAGSVSAEHLTSAAPRQPGRTHVVSSGETFVSIARAAYGDGRYYQALIDANPSVDPDKLKPGMSIQVPPDSQVKQSHKSSKAAPASNSSSASANGKTYTVQNGDSLYKIAKKLYGSGEKCDELYEANKQTIGPDSTRLKIGMVLTLP